MRISSRYRRLSDALSISKERVRQIENKLREKLRAFLSKKLGTELEDWVDTDESGGDS